MIKITSLNEKQIKKIVDVGLILTAIVFTLSSINSINKRINELETKTNLPTSTVLLKKL